MLSENHGVVTGCFRIEHRVSMIIPIAESARHIELPLGLTRITLGS